MRGILLAATAVAMVQSGALAAQPGYAVTKTVTLGSPERWDYLAFDKGRVFIAHGDRVTVVDGRSGKLLGHVAGLTESARGVAIINGRGYVDDAKAGTAASFDAHTLAPGKTSKATPDADAIVTDPKTGHVFVLGGHSGQVTVIDSKTDRVIATIEIGGDMEAGAVDGAGKLYINSEKGEVVRIDTASNRIDARWPVADCEKPQGMALDTNLQRLFASCANSTMVVLDLRTGKQVAKLPIGKGAAGLVFDSKRKLVVSANGNDGTLSVIRVRGADRFEVAATIPTAITARTLTIDPASGRLYLAAIDLVPGVVDANGKRVRIPGSLKLMFLDPATN
jgi:YVTN family beta-propeller protein